MYMIPSDMNLRIGRIKNYNNKILELKSYFKLGINKKINFDEEKGKPDVKPEGEAIVKTKPDVKQKKEPDVKSNKEHKPNIELKHDVKIIRTRPDMNKITYEEEKVALILGTTAVFTVDVQMTYPLLVFVMKYVYIKTPTPVMRAHKF